MAIGAKPDVIRQIPTIMIGIRVNHDVVRVPEPVAASVIVVRRNAKVEAAEPKTVPVSALKPIDMAAANFARETSVLKRMIQVVVLVVSTSVMTNPLIIVRVNVRRRRMSSLVAIVRVLIALRSASSIPSVSGRNGRSDRCGTVRGNVPLANSGSLRSARGGPSLLLPRLLLFVGPLLSQSGS